MEWVNDQLCPVKYENRSDIMAMKIVSKKMKMYEGYVIDGRKIIGMTNHSHSFCYMEDTLFEYLALWKTLSEGEWVGEKDTGTDILALSSPTLQE